MNYTIGITEKIRYWKAPLLQNKIWSLRGCPIVNTALLKSTQHAVQSALLCGPAIMYSHIINDYESLSPATKYDYLCRDCMRQTCPQKESKQ